MPGGGGMPGNPGGGGGRLDMLVAKRSSSDLERVTVTVQNGSRLSHLKLSKIPTH